MNKKRFYFIVSSALALCICSFPAGASTVLFSDLDGDVYAEQPYFGVTGSGTALGALTVANQFTLSGVGSFSVSEMDIAMVGQGIGTIDAFSASIWTDIAGNPGAQVNGAYWGASAPFDPGGLVSIPGITGVTLTGGQAYFLVIGPLNASSFVGFSVNTQGVTGDDQYSLNGGLTWIDSSAEFGISSIGAFEILGDLETATTPEPTLMPMLLLGVGLIGIFAARENIRERLRAIFAG